MGTLWLPQGQKPMSGQRVDYQQWCGARPSFSTWMNAGAGAIVADDSGNGNHGTLTGMDPATDWVGTPYGPGLDFDGSNDEVALSGLFNDQSFTVVARCYARSIANYKGLVTCRDDNLGKGWGLACASSKLSLFGYGLTPQATSSASNILLNTWITVGVVHNKLAGLTDIYFNGVLDASGSHTGTLTPATLPGSIGRLSNAAGNFWSGMISWLHYWPSVFSASQVAALQGPVPVYARTFYSIPEAGGAKMPMPVLRAFDRRVA